MRGARRLRLPRRQPGARTHEGDADRPRPPHSAHRERALVRRAQNRSLLHRLATRFGLTVGLALAVAGSVSAYFTSTGTGTAFKGLTTLAAPTISSATPGVGSVALSWSAVSAPGSGTVTYYVTRDGGAGEGNCPTSTETSTVTSCTDTGVALGTHEYKVTAVWRSWTATSTAASATVVPGPATHFQLAAASTTPAAGEADSLTVTALDAVGNVATSYTGSHNLTFGGAGNSPSGSHPTVSSATGVATNFGTAEAVTFTNGVASVTGANNGVMRLYKTEAASVTVAAGAVTNGTGLPVTVSAAAAVSLSLAAASVTPTAGVADNLTITVKDVYGNAVASYSGSHNLTFGGPHVIGAFTPTVTDGSGVATSVGTATAVTFTNGVASVSGSSNGVMTLYKAEAVSLTVTDGTLTNGAGLAVTVGPAAAASLTLGAASLTPTVGVADNLTVTAKDAYGNTATAYAGSHNLTYEGAGNGPNGNAPTVSSSAGTVTSFGTATAITFTAGVASVAGANNGVMKLYRAEAALVTVTDGTLGNGAGLTVTAAAAAAASFSLTAASTALTVGEADSLTVTALDAFGNVAVSYTGSKNLTFGGAAVSVGGNHPTVSSGTGVATNFGTATAITFTAGVASVTGANNGVMRLYKAETASVTVAAGAVTNGTGLSVTASVGAAASLGLAAASVTPTAGVADNLTITVKDAYGNTITSYTGSHSLTFGGPHVIGAFTPTVTDGSGVATSVGTATAVTFTNGVASVSGSSNGVMTLYKAEAVSLTVTDGTLTNGAGLAVTVGPAAAASLTLGAASLTPTVGVADNLTVTAKDAYGNTATAYAGSHNLTYEGAGNGPNGNAPTVSSSAGTVTSFGTATAITFTAGVASVAGANNGVMKLYRAEAALVTVTDGTLGNGAGLTVTAAAAAAASFSLTAASTALTVGEADSLTVTALDAFGNVAVSYTGSKNLTFGGAGVSVGGNHPTVSSGTGVATNFGTATAITFTAGLATVSGSSNGVLKLYKVETASLTVTAGAVTNGMGLSITVSVGAAASLALAATSTTPAAGASDNLTITAEDAYGNTITTYTGSHNLTFGGPHVVGTYTPTVTSSTGVATNIGTATAIEFTNGVATVSGSSNGVMTLYKAETVSVTVTDGTLSNGAGQSVTVSPGAATSLTLGAASLTPAVGAADNLTVTAKDTYGNTATAYAGSHNLTYAGASNGPNGNLPTVSSSAGTVTSFGTGTAITFTAGVATVAGANNGVMKLYRAEAASVTVTDGTISNGAGLTVTPVAGAAANLAWVHVTLSAGSLSSPCLFTCTVTGLGESGTFTAKVAVTDTYGNTVSGVGAGHTETVSTPASGEGSGGSFTAPTVGTSVTMTIATAGAAESTAQFTFKAQSGAWVSDTMTVQKLAGTAYTSATATLNR
jgi:hypothetical protein